MSDRIERIEGAAETFLRDGDVLANQIAFPTSRAGQTVSDDVAELAEPADKCQFCWRVGSAFCWFLNWAVQRDHCLMTLTDGPMPWTVYARAGFWFTAGMPLAVAIVSARVLWLKLKG